jgi:acetyltransferase-like isoleucine patch superfamily enzyme
MAMMIYKLISFLYFQLFGQIRAGFWKFFLKISGGHLGKCPKLYEHVRINCSRPQSIFIGDHFHMLRGATISASPTGTIKVGNRVHLGEYSIITSSHEILIGDDVTIGPHTIIVDLDHRYGNPELPINQQGVHCKKVIIENDVWIASNCSILKGVTIGKGAIIGAGSVVTRSISPNSIAVGVPAREIKKRTIESPENQS